MIQACFEGNLNTEINGGCSNQVYGAEKVSVLIPNTIIDKSTLAVEADTVIIKTLELLGASLGVKVQEKGDNPYKDLTIESTKGAYVMLTDTTSPFKILEVSPATVKQMMQLSNGGYTQVLQMVGYDWAKKNKYMVIGLNRGLRFETGSFSMASQDDFGLKITMMEKEGLVPVYFYSPADGLEATADAWFNGLTA